jgi:hypothetical protein
LIGQETHHKRFGNGVLELDPVVSGPLPRLLQVHHPAVHDLVLGLALAHLRLRRLLALERELEIGRAFFLVLFLFRGRFDRGLP